MSEKAIIEIGPIFDYIYSTRKSRDLWGASFLFSYLMGEIAHFLETNGAEIKRPALKNDQLFQTIKNGNQNFSKVNAGTIPDQIYCELDDVSILKELKNHLYEILKSLLEDSKNNLTEHFKVYFDKTKDHSIEAEVAQLQNYFRLFYVYSDQDSFDVLEQASFSRGRLFEFEKSEDGINTVDNKYERCLLCGDRKAMFVIKNIRPDNNFKHEPLCAVCTIKRGLREKFKPKWSFPSTTAIASTSLEKFTIPKYFTQIKQDLIKFIKAQIEDEKLKYKLIDEIGKEKYDSLLKSKDSLDKKPVDKLLSCINFQILFSNELKDAKELRSKLKKLLKEEIKNEFDPEALESLRTQLIWLERPFYAMVAMDADGMGSLLNKLGNLAENGNAEAEKLADSISASIGQFANSLYFIVKKFNGLLFYAGGEDLLFMVHPAFLLQMVQNIAGEFYEKVVKTNQDKIEKVVGEPTLTISAGAYICFHKHPLKLAIQGAHYQLDEVAKKQPGKNTLAIQLYKGGGERANVILQILNQNKNNRYTIEEFKSFVSKINREKIEIPRGFVYKLSEEYEVMSKVINNQTDLLNYVKFLFSKSRNGKGFSTELESLTVHSCKCNNGNFDYQELINRLYFLRFLTGEGA